MLKIMIKLSEQEVTDSERYPHQAWARLLLYKDATVLFVQERCIVSLAPNNTFLDINYTCLL